MKKVILYEILKKLKSDPKLMKKVKAFLIVGSIVFVVMSGLIIWAGVSAVKYIASTTSQAIESPIAQGQVENLKSELKQLPKFQLASCWLKTQSLMTVQTWLEKPLQENFKNLKTACFENNIEASPATEYF